MRTFTSPSGRRWVAEVIAGPASSPRVDDGARAPGVGAVLRFRSDSLVLELHDWPAEWETLPDDALVALVRRAQPPGLGIVGDARRSGAGER